MPRAFLLALPAALLLTGCLSTVGKVVTAPVRVVSSGVDAVTTSQSEADEKRGRALRKQEEELGKLARKRSDAIDDCNDGDRKACEKVRELDEEIERVRARDI